VVTLIPHNYKLFQNWVSIRYTGNKSGHDITDEPRAVIDPLIPQQNPGPGRKRTPDRHTLNGILFVLKTGCTCEEVSRASGSLATCWRRFRRWAADGMWEEIWGALLSQLDTQRKEEQRPTFPSARPTDPTPAILKYLS
jgi:transposase